jgi:hypothetical protein
VLPLDVESVSEPFPLNSDKALEASTPVKQRSIEVKENGLNFRQHHLCA